MTRTTLIVGGGAAAALSARRLAGAHDHRVVVVDPSPEPGAGPAYDKAAPWHLLNSPAASMSVEPDDPTHFITWAASVGHPVSADEFAPRSLYGRYLRAMLAATPGVQVVPGTVLDVDDTLTVHTDTGKRLAATDVVLAVGNPSGGRPVPALTGHPRYLHDPWNVEDIPEGPVLLIGTGLTAVDMALSVTRRYADTRVDAVSRHGLLPRSHRPFGEVAATKEFTVEPTASLSRLVASVRNAVAHTGDWRAVVDGMRPHIDSLWIGLDASSQRRFIEHVARVWEVHRHRMAPTIATDVDRLRATGRLTVAADRIVDVEVERRDRIGVTFAGGEHRDYAAVINCTGPGRLPAGADRLVAGLLSAGRARVGPYRLGLDVDRHGHVVDAHGRVNRHLWVLGALRRGCLWETTAVPEIRRQAVALADAITATPVETATG